ncbi:phosphatidylglycerol lysyltransferase domain-containing protein [Desulfotomaculum defluvii]
MINFKNVELSDKIWMEPLITSANLNVSHINFTNIFAWSEIYNYRIAQINNFLVVKGRINNGYHYYFYPVGWGDPKSVIESMKQDAADCGHDFIILGLTSEHMTELESMYPERFKYKEMRDSFDYVYLLEKLVSLSGNKLHSKRNHINRFKQTNNWRFETISAENLLECWKMNVIWCKEHDCHKDKQLANEDCAVRRCFKNFKALGLEGGLIRLDEKVIAYTMGEQLNSDTYVIHIEKAFGNIRGAYQMINREFAAFIQEKHPQLTFINREEDMGYEGLRKAKLSYYPDKMAEKYEAIFLPG